jgi:hypothetical protein
MWVYGAARSHVTSLCASDLIPGNMIISVDFESGNFGASVGGRYSSWIGVADEIGGQEQDGLARHISSPRIKKWGAIVCDDEIDSRSLAKKTGE